MKFINKKMLIILIILVLGLISAFFGYNFFTYRNVKIDKIILNDENFSNMFAIMIEQEDGTYDKSDNNMWPSEDYLYNTERSGCLDEYGNNLNNVLSYDYYNEKVIVKSSRAFSCYLFFEIREPDVYATFTTGGDVGTPNSNGYKSTVNCEEGVANWNSKYWRFEVTGVTNGKADCNVNFTKDTSNYTTNYLNNYIKSLSGTTQGNGKVVNETITDDFTADSITTLAEDDYTVVANNSGVFTFNTSNQWEGNMAKHNTNYTFTVRINADGMYNFCYDTTNMYKYNAVYRYATVDIKLSGSSSRTLLSIKSGNTIDDIPSSKCIIINNIKSTDTITVTMSKTVVYTNILKFSFQKIEGYEAPKTYDTGYRYQGVNPNNYIWFNNELWRIIGVDDVTLPDGETKEDLTKIVRAEPIVVPPFYHSTIVELNKYYYNKSSGATCYGNDWYFTKINCNFENIGINKEYRPLIKEVIYGQAVLKNYVLYKAYVADLFPDFSSSRKISYLNVVDLMFSTLSSVCNRRESFSETCLQNSWLYRHTNQILDSSYNSATRYIAISSTRLTTRGYAFSNDRVLDGVAGHNMSLVLYLDSNVYVVSGSGSITDPYIIAMN